MTHLLQQISWHDYLSAVLTITVIYYVIVILRCYRPELQTLKKHFSGDKDSAVLEALQYPGREADPESPVTARVDLPAPLQSISEGDVLAGSIKACIALAADKPFAPAILMDRIKELLQKQPVLSASAERPAINQLIVRECEKTGTALLSEDEADQWWSV